MAKIRDYGKLAADIKDIIGESNITAATHCATRLRSIRSSLVCMLRMYTKSSARS